MIDVHCLIHKESPFFSQLEEQMKGEENVSFYPIKNGRNIGAGRVQGFLTGSNSYVSFVDYDDLIQPGIFKEIEELLERGYDWVYTDEMLMDVTGKEIQPGWSSHPDLYTPELLTFMEFNGKGDHCHHLIAFKRELLKLDSFFILLQLAELSECFLFKVLGRSSNFYHLNKIGYFWRQHRDNGYKDFAAFKVISEMLEKRGMID